MIDERSSSSILRKTISEHQTGSNPQPSNNRLDTLIIELPRFRWLAKVQVRHVWPERRPLSVNVILRIGLEKRSSIIQEILKLPHFHNIHLKN